MASVLAGVLYAMRPWPRPLHLRMPVLLGVFAVLVAAKYARVLNEFPRDRSAPGEKKLTTRALEELTEGQVEYRVVPRRRTE